MTEQNDLAGTKENVPNDYLQRRRQRTDSERAPPRAKIQKKNGGIDLLVMPPSLNDKLSLWCPRSVNWSAVRQNGRTA